MKCHLKTTVLLSWLYIGNYMFVMAMHSVSTTCGKVPANTSSDREDGSNMFKIVLGHSVLDPYLDILPNLTYTVSLQSMLMDIPIAGFSIEISDNQSLSENSSNKGFTILDNDTESILSRNKDEQEISCNADKENSIKWTPYVHLTCLYISVVVLLENSSVPYHLSSNICRLPGNRSYHAVNISGYISSPSYPQTYPDNYNHTYIIFSLKKASIKLQFQSFNLESSYRGTCFDKVTVISDKIDIFCGSMQDADLEKLYFESNNSKLVLKMSTDNKIGHSGFSALYYIPDLAECNRSLTLTSGNITSISYPDMYFPRMECTLNIILPPEYRIEIVIRYIDIERKTNDACVNDYLQIQSNNFNYFLCGNLSDIGSEYYTMQTASSLVDVAFISNFLHEGKGFWLEYQSYISCSNQTFTNVTGSVHSDNYPNFYLNNQDCFYTIQLPIANSLELIFDRFDTEALQNTFSKGQLCNLDYVEIYEADKSERICGKWNSKVGSLIFRSDSGILSFRFVTNHNVTKSGFHAIWRTSAINVSAVCDSIWIEKDQDEYEIVRTYRTWEESQTDCQQKGGFLASVPDLTTQRMLETFLKNSSNCTLEMDAFWIGVNDIQTENIYQWVSGHPVDFTYWFPGWLDNDFTNRQPSDDGLADEDCVEMRQTFHNVGKGTSNVQHYFWNDRQCSIRNPYICQFSKTGEIKMYIWNCIAEGNMRGINDDLPASLYKQMYRIVEMYMCRRLYKQQ